MHSLAKTHVHQMAKSTATELTSQHLHVLDYAWQYYRERRVGPLGTNIRRNTGLSVADLEMLFPNGLSSVYTWVGIPVQSTRAGCKPIALLEVENPMQVYLDNNATTPVRSEVVEALVAFFRNQTSFGNPSSSYVRGGEAYDIIDLARHRIAGCLGVDPSEVFFTGSGSEANNLAIKGIAARYESGHVISSNVEHPSVLETLRYLEGRGFSVTYLPVGKDGTLDADQVKEAIQEDTVLVTIMAANNEIGTIYPFAEIGAVCQSHNIPFVADSIQAFGKIPLRPKAMGIDVLTLSGHKICAPKGVGAIYVNPDINLEPLIHGGSQENGLRAGTENVAGIMALGLAAKLACQEMTESTAHFEKLRDHFLMRLEEVEPESIINGVMENRLAHNLSVGFKGVDSGSLLLSFNQIGVCVSAGSACSAGDEELSHVLQAIGATSDEYGTIRFSFGKTNSTEEIDYLFEHLPKILAQLRAHHQGLKLH